MKKLGNVFILGDSYSTFEGAIDKDCWLWYYKEPRNDTDVCKAEQTWWIRLLNNTDSNLVCNSSYSGTTICHTGYDNADWSEKFSFSARLRNLVNSGYFEENHFDTFIIFGGTNDSWANSPLGEIKYGVKTEKELFSVKPAYCYLIETVKANCPNAKIVTIINTELKPEIVECFKEVSSHYSTHIIELHDIEKQSGHPNIKGMKQIFEQVLNAI